MSFGAPDAGQGRNLTKVQSLTFPGGPRAEPLPIAVVYFSGRSVAY